MSTERSWTFYDDGNEAVEDGVKGQVMPHIAVDPDKDARATFWIRGDAERYVRDRNREAGIATETGDAHDEVDSHMRSRLDEIHNLDRLANPDVDLDEWSNDELLALDIGYGVEGALSREYIQEAAEEQLNEYPLCVEATTTFEVVLGTGGPDDLLLFECRKELGTKEDPSDFLDAHYEIRRVLYRYSWMGSATRVLTGDLKEVAEEFARRVVPELSE